jgi:hypothetical protein
VFAGLRGSVGRWHEPEARRSAVTRDLDPRIAVRKARGKL